MPIYTYECQKCHKEFSQCCSVNDYKEEHLCPYCEGTAKRIFKRARISIHIGGELPNAELIRHTKKGITKEKIKRTKII